MVSGANCDREVAKLAKLESLKEEKEVVKVENEKLHEILTDARMRKQLLMMEVSRKAFALEKMHMEMSNLEGLENKRRKLIKKKLEIQERMAALVREKQSVIEAYENDLKEGNWSSKVNEKITALTTVKKDLLDKIKEVRNNSKRAQARILEIEEANAEYTAVEKMAAGNLKKGAAKLNAMKLQLKELKEKNQKLSECLQFTEKLNQLH